MAASFEELGNRQQAPRNLETGGELRGTWKPAASSEELGNHGRPIQIQENYLMPRWGPAPMMARWEPAPIMASWEPATLKDLVEGGRPRSHRPKGLQNVNN